jgi:hypothetical protein
MDQFMIEVAVVGIVLTIVYVIYSDRVNRKNIHEALRALNEKVISIKRTSNNFIYIDFRYQIEIVDKNGNRKLKECKIGPNRKIEWINKP